MCDCFVHKPSLLSFEPLDFLWHSPFMPLQSSLHVWRMSFTQVLQCSVWRYYTPSWKMFFFFISFFYWEMSYALLSCVILKYLHGHGNIKSRVALVYREAQWNFNSLHKSCQETSWTELMRMRDEKKKIKHKKRGEQSPLVELPWINCLSQEQAAACWVNTRCSVWQNRLFCSV